MQIIKRISPARFLVIGFAFIILLGTALLMLPISTNEGVWLSPLDALFTATSAVCVTGLVVFDTANTFNVFGRTIIALLIQIGGLGISSVGVGFIILAGKKVTFRERKVVKEALNLDSMKGIVRIVKSVFLMTLLFEGIGAIINFFVFIKDYPPLKAVGVSVFHSISAFNNAGFDVFGNFSSLTGYQDNVLLNLNTSGLIIFGGLGFFVLMDIIEKRSFRRLTLHSKIVLFMTSLLIFSGMMLFKVTEKISWLGAFFQSVTTRTAGFNTYSISIDDFSKAGLFIIMVLMFIGASPGSTGGGIKTTTAFTLFKSAYSMSTNKHCMAFKRRIPNDIVMKAFVITFLSMSLIIFDTIIISIFEPHFTFNQILFEVISAFATVGLSTGITPELSAVSRVIIIITMFTGRLGPLTMASIWYNKPESNISYSEENITIG
ncbi:H(+)-transporting ATPase [Mobilitalea sibirica]|uniref:H(+)-transporting ATPase n=1 Tax=Mobilitalea sibirica TaxID=1462919 RepID=A0A8J7KSP0_9FIRM|nr:TrkH family potassium uptake protein [Mobilitalea sibirica]MBH1940491.1 H(+)-transporting ATPase [Mobilitalea sibirica]